MKAKFFLLTWFPVFIFVFALNGLFHTVLAASFFDKHLSHLGQAVHKMADSNPVPVAVLDAIITLGMSYFIVRNTAGKISVTSGIIAGGLINLVSSGAWNLANAAVFEWPLIVTIGDMTWHIGLGAAGGALMVLIYNRAAKRE